MNDFEHEIFEISESLDMYCDLVDQATLMRLRAVRRVRRLTSLLEQHPELRQDRTVQYQIQTIAERARIATNGELDI